AAQQREVHQAGQGYVVGVAALPGEKSRVLEPAQTLTNTELTHALAPSFRGACRRREGPRRGRAGMIGNPPAGAKGKTRKGSGNPCASTLAAHGFHRIRLLVVGGRRRVESGPAVRPARGGQPALGVLA